MSSSILISKIWLAVYLLTLMCSVIVGWVYTVYFEPETKFWAQAFKERRGEFIEGRKVLFTGDSACSFGIDAVIFREEAEMLAYNLGGTRQMGVRVFMDEALSHASENDVVVLIANPVLLVSGARSESHPKAGARMALALSEEVTAGEFVDATRPGFNHLVSLGGKVAFGMPMYRYGEGDRQEFGYMITAKRDHPAASLVAFDMMEEMNVVRETLMVWAARCLEKKVSLCYLLPLELTDSSILEENRLKKAAFMRELQDEVPSVKILTTPMHGCTDDEGIFADTLFHLTEEGAADFTRRLAPLVKGAL